MILQSIKKEIWHNKHWMALAIGFILFFTTVIYIERHEQIKYYANKNYAANTSISNWSLYSSSTESLKIMEIRSFPAIYFIAAVGLGILISISQFWVPFFTNTWKFTLHRPQTRAKLLTIMISAAAFMIALIAGGGWTLLWLKARANFALPPTTTALAEGWLFVLQGFMTYLAVTLVALSETKWLTSKLYPLLLVLLAWIAIWMNTTFTGALIVAGIYMTIVIPLIYHQFATREF